MSKLRFIFISWLLAAPFVAYGTEKNPSCVTLFSEVGTVAGREQLNKLGSTKMNSIFSSQYEVDAGEFKGQVWASLTRDEMDQFQKLFSQYVDKLAATNPVLLPNKYQYQKWLKLQNPRGLPYPVLNPQSIGEVYNKQNLTMKDFVTTEVLKFRVKTDGNTPEKFWTKMNRLWPEDLGAVGQALARVPHLTWVGTKEFSKWSIGIVGPAAFAYSMFKFYGKSIDDFMEPLVDRVQAKGNQKTIGKQIAEVVSPIDPTASFAGGKENFFLTLNELDSAVTVFQSVKDDEGSREKAREGMQEEERYIGERLRMFSASLDVLDKNRHEEIKEKVFKPMIPSAIAAMSAYKATAETLRELKEKVQDVGGQGTEEQRKEIAEVQSTLNKLEESMAKTLALWRVYKMTLPREKGEKDPVIFANDSSLAPVYTEYMRTLSLPRYRSEFTKVVKYYEEKLRKNTAKSAEPELPQPKKSE